MSKTLNSCLWHCFDKVTIGKRSKRMSQEALLCSYKMIGSLILILLFWQASMMIKQTRRTWCQIQAVEDLYYLTCFLVITVLPSVALPPPLSLVTNRNLPSKPAFVKPRSCTQLFPTKLKTMFHETSEWVVTRWITKSLLMCFTHT